MKILQLLRKTCGEVSPENFPLVSLSKQNWLKLIET